MIIVIFSKDIHIYYLVIYMHIEKVSESKGVYNDLLKENSKKREKAGQKQVKSSFKELLKVKLEEIQTSSNVNRTKLRNEEQER